MTMSGTTSVIWDWLALKNGYKLLNGKKLSRRLVFVKAFFDIFCGWIASLWPGSSLWLRLLRK